MESKYQQFMRHVSLECRWAHENFNIKEWMASWKALPINDKKYYSGNAGWNYWRSH